MCTRYVKEKRRNKQQFTLVWCRKVLDQNSWSHITSYYLSQMV